MQGKIIGWNAAKQTGVITTATGQRLMFPLAEWSGGGQMPQAGAVVEFIADKDRARQVRLVQAAPRATVSQPAPAYTAPPQQPVHAPQPAYAAQAPAAYAPPPQAPQPQAVQTSLPPGYHPNFAVSTNLSIYAGFWKRVGAWFIDYLLLVLLLIAPSILFIQVLLPLFASGEAAAVTASGLIGTFGVLLMSIYFAAFHSSARQATPGKRVLKIKVVGANGQRISFLHAWARFFCFWAGGVTCGIHLIMAAFTQRKQALHDIIVSTLVVNDWATANP